jgi:hypothetical protein
MKTTLLVSSLGIALLLGSRPAAARPAFGSAGPLNGNYAVTLTVKSYSQSDKPNALPFDDTLKTFTLKGVLSIGDAISDFDSNLSASGTVSSTNPLLPAVQLNLNGLRRGKTVYLAGSAIVMETGNGGSPFPNGSIVLTGRITTNKNTQKATNLNLTGLANEGSTIDSLKMTGKQAILD